MYMNHSAVNAVLQKPGAGEKHARWWVEVHGSGVKNVSIRYWLGRENSSADALSRSPVQDQFHQRQMPVTVTPVHIDGLTVSDLLEQIPDAEQSAASLSLKEEQRKDPKILELIKYLEDGTLPCDEKQCHRVVAKSTLFALVDGVLFYVDPKRKHQKRAVVPDHLREEIMQSVHGSPFAEHYSIVKLVITYFQLCFPYVVYVLMYYLLELYMLYSHFMCNI